MTPLAHLVNRGELLRAVGRRAREPRHLLGILAQRVEKAREETLLALDETPVDAPAVNEGVEVPLAKVGPLGTNLGQGLLARHAEVARRPQHAGALGTQAGGELGARSGGEFVLDEANGVRELARVLEARDLCGKPVVKVSDVLVRRVEFAHLVFAPRLLVMARALRAQGPQRHIRPMVALTSSSRLAPTARRTRGAPFAANLGYAARPRPYSPLAVDSVTGSKCLAYGGQRRGRAYPGGRQGAPAAPKQNRGIT